MSKLEEWKGNLKDNLKDNMEVFKREKAICEKRTKIFENWKQNQQNSSLFAITFSSK